MSWGDNIEFRMLSRDWEDFDLEVAMGYDIRQAFYMAKHPDDFQDELYEALHVMIDLETDEDEFEFERLEDEDLRVNKGMRFGALLLFRHG